MIDIIEPGFVTTIQDEGRSGHYKRGIPPSGAMDMESYRLGNGLVGNPPGAAGLEFTFMGPKITFTDRTVFAVTGGDIPIRLNDEEISGWKSHAAEPGDVLSFGFLGTGVRGYISFRGGLDVPQFLGSRSTHVNSGFGGFEGRKLAVGDKLSVVDGAGSEFAARELAEQFRPSHSKSVELRYVPGLFNYRLSDTGRKAFDEREWSVTPNADRTGIRLASVDKTPLEFIDRTPPFGAGSDPSNVVDAGYPIGAIQIPSGVEPIVLARDAVTAGGYFTAGAVITADLDRLGQAPTHGSVVFQPVSVETALAARAERSARIAAALESLG